MRRAESILQNSLFIFLARVIDLGAAIIGFVLVARCLGVEGLGRYSFVIAYVSVFGLVVNFGIDHIIIREVAKRRDYLGKIIGAAFRLKLYLLLITAPLLVGGLFIFKLDTELKSAVLLLFLAQVILRELFTIVAQAVFLACERLEFRALTTLAFQLLRTGAIAVALLTGRGLVALFALSIVADIVQSYWTWFIVKRNFAPADLAVDKSEILHLFRQSFPIGLAFGFTTAFLQLDVLLLKGMRGDYENGLFSSAYRIISTLILVIVPVIWVLLPHLTRTFQQSRERLKTEGEFYLKCIAGVMFPAAILLALYARPILTFAFGEEYAPAGLALVIVAPTLALRGISYLFDLSLTAAGRQIIVAIGASTAFIVKLALELVLIPRYGFIGAAWGTLGAEVSAFILVLLLVRNYVAKYRLKVLLKPLLAGGVTLVFLYWLKNPLLGIPLGAILFLLMLILIGTFNREERENIVSLAKKR